MIAPELPPGFVWGSAPAAHHIEAYNWNNVWWQWEHAPGTPCTQPSGDACDHAHRYPGDIALLAPLGWLASQGGWTDAATPELFAPFVDRVVDRPKESS